MEFGSNGFDPKKIKTTLPTDCPSNQTILNTQKPFSQRKLLMGAPVWARKEWIGKLYPKGTKSTDFLKLYGTCFNSIELNSTFYRIPSPRTVESWCTSVPKDFQFCPKLPKQISHAKNLEPSDETLQRVMESYTVFGKKIGRCLLQLPPYFSHSKQAQLDHLLKRLKGLPLAVEFRNPNFFGKNTLLEDTLELLQKHNASTVITDTPGRRDVLHMSLSQPVAFIRFLGIEPPSGSRPSSKPHASDQKRVRNWIKRLSEWFDQGLQKSYFFIHHPSYEFLPELGEEFACLAEKHLQIELPHPTLNAA